MNTITRSVDICLVSHDVRAAPSGSALSSAHHPSVQAFSFQAKSSLGSLLLL